LSVVARRRQADEAIFDSLLHDGAPFARMGQYYVYLLTNFTNTVIYTGVTNDLLRRVQQHRERVNGAFTSRYNVWKLVYYEATGDVASAIAREKQIKGGPRRRKIALIESMNPGWRDLFQGLLE
jgi:putative endonuclease